MSSKKFACSSAVILVRTTRASWSIHCIDRFLDSQSLLQRGTICVAILMLNEFENL